MTDDVLIEKMLAGDENAFREFIKKYESRIASIVIRMLGNTPEAEDVGQETFIRFFQSMDKFRKESSIGTYLTRIAINLSLNELKKRKRRSFLSLDKSSKSINFDIADENRYHEKEDARELVNRALAQLEPKFRTVVILRLVEGYSTQETAEILKLPTGTVLSRLARGQKKLKQILQWLGE